MQILVFGNSCLLAVFAADVWEQTVCSNWSNHWSSNCNISRIPEEILHVWELLKESFISSRYISVKMRYITFFVFKVCLLWQHFTAVWTRCKLISRLHSTCEKEQHLLMVNMTDLTNIGNSNQRMAASLSILWGVESESCLWLLSSWLFGHLLEIKQILYMNANARYELTDVELTADHPNPTFTF